MKDGIIVALVVVLMLIAIVALQSLIYWGIGYLIVWVFGIQYVWTFWHGLATALVVSILVKIFKTTITVEGK